MIDVVMPQMGESIVEGTLTKWLKKPGDHVERDEPLFEISTDKVDTEIPSPAAGMLDEMLVEEGKTVGDQHGGGPDRGRRGQWGCGSAPLLPAAPARRAASAASSTRTAAGCAKPRASCARPACPNPCAFRRPLSDSGRRTCAGRGSRITRGSAFAAGAQDGAREQHRS